MSSALTNSGVSSSLSSSKGIVVGIGLFDREGSFGVVCSGCWAGGTISVCLASFLAFMR